MSNILLLEIDLSSHKSIRLFILTTDLQNKYVSIRVDQNMGGTLLEFSMRTSMHGKSLVCNICL